MMRYLLLAAALAACTGKSNRADSVDAAMPAIDTLKAVTTSDTLVTAPDTAGLERARPGFKSKTEPLRTKTRPDTRARDSAFPPPANLPRLDTVKKKPA